VRRVAPSSSWISSSATAVETPPLASSMKGCGISNTVSPAASTRAIRPLSCSWMVRPEAVRRKL
jgi:hypothetical protein